MGSFTQVYFNGRKVMLRLQFILGAVKNRLGSSVAYYQAQLQNFGPFKRLGNKRPRLRPCQNWSKWPILPIFEKKIAEIFMFF